MIAYKLRISLLFAFLFTALRPDCFAQEKYLPYPAVIHIHSNVSGGGVYSPAGLANLAKSTGIKILIFSDTFLSRWEYATPVLPNLLKISIDGGSVVRYGIRRYLENFKRVRKEFPDMLILEGVEATPFYWWSGSLFKKNLTLHDGQKDLLVTGLRNYDDYANLPVVGNRSFFPGLKDLPVLLIFLALFISGVFIYQKKKPTRLLGAILSVAGFFFFLNYFPFSPSRYNSYHGYKKYLPYQDLINYVKAKKGLIFWSHLTTTELSSAVKFATVNFYSPNYPESLALTVDYTGFAVSLSQGTGDDFILPGGAWDNILISYCAGKRKQPAWVIGEADYRGPGPIASEQNILLLSEFKPESVYGALRQGRFYVRCYLKDEIDISLDSFQVKDTLGAAGQTAFMGGEIKIKGKPTLRIRGTSKINSIDVLNMQIIRDGRVIKEAAFEKDGAFNSEFQDDLLQPSSRKSYYRLNFILGGKIILAANPIFIEMQNE